MQMPPTVDPKDWTTLWQSELAALAVDRECHEGLAAFSTAWSQLAIARHDASTAPATASGPSSGHDGPARRPGPDAPPGAAPLDAAPDARDDEITRLRARIAELERSRG